MKSPKPAPECAAVNEMPPRWRSPLKGRPVFIAVIVVALLGSVDDPDKPKSRRLLASPKRPIEQFSDAAPFIGPQTMFNRKNWEASRSPSFSERSEVRLETLLPVIKSQG